MVKGGGPAQARRTFALRGVASVRAATYRSYLVTAVCADIFTTAICYERWSGAWLNYFRGVCQALRAHEAGRAAKTPDEWQSQVNSRGMLESLPFAVGGQVTTQPCWLSGGIGSSASEASIRGSAGWCVCTCANTGSRKTGCPAAARCCLSRRG